MSRRTLWITGFLASLAVPYFSLDGNVPQFFQQFRSQWQTPNSAAPQNYAFDPQLQTSANPHGDWHWPQLFGSGETMPHAPVAMQNTPVVLLQEAIRHELTPQWVLSRWPTATPVGSDAGQTALRVPLITGYQPHDVVGSLTYTFDSKQQLARIAFIGQTQEETMLLTYLVPAFGLQPQVSLHGQLFTNQHEGYPLSMVLVEGADATQNSAGKRIVWELNRPVPGARMSNEMRQHLQPGNAV